MLEEAGLIQVEKGYAGRRPRTSVGITSTGRAALAAEVATLAELVRRHRAGDTTLDVGIPYPPPTKNHMPAQAATPVRPAVP